MTVKPRLALVLSSRQLIVAQVAAALCSSVTEQPLEGWEHYRVGLGDDFDRLARRLRAARELDEASGARLAQLADSSGRPVVAVRLELSADEVRCLRVALDRLRGILARSREFGGALDEDIDRAVSALEAV